MELKKNTMKSMAGLIAFGIILYWIMNHPHVAFQILGRGLSLISPLLLGICIAFIMNVLLRLIERLWDILMQRRKVQWKNRYKRPLCLCLTLIMITGSIFIILFMIVPELQRTAMEIVDMIPWYLNEIEHWTKEFSMKFSSGTITLPEFKIDTKAAMDVIGGFLTRSGESVFNKTMEMTTSIFSTLFNLVLGLIFSIYILLSKEKLYSQCKKMLYAFLPEKKAAETIEVMKLTNQTFSKFVTGQFTEALIIGVLCFLGMSILSIPYATMISVLVGFTALIPVFGAFIGTAVGILMIITVNPMKAIWFVIFIVVLQQIEGNLIYPKVVGKSVGLPGMWVLFAVTIGGNGFGILGMLVGVPACSVLYALTRKTVYRKLKEKRISKECYR